MLNKLILKKKKKKILL